jgi:hypothetical protein
LRSKLTRMIRTRRCWSLLLLSAILFGLAAAKLSAEPFGPFPEPTDHKRLASVRESGRHRDTKAVPGLIAVLTLDI